MLRMECFVEGNQLHAHVDTGAQVTVMSRKCAQRCGLMSIVDQSFTGDAKGVGSTRIVGKIEGIELWIGKPAHGVKLDKVRMTILDQLEPDMLLGMDLLLRGQCEIRILDNVLKFHTSKVDHDVDDPPTDLLSQKKHKQAMKKFKEIPFLNSARSNSRLHSAHERRQSLPCSSSSSSPSSDFSSRCLQAKADNHLRYDNKKNFSLSGM